MTAKNSDSLIGFDPLAWIGEDDALLGPEESAAAQLEESAGAVADGIERSVEELRNQEALGEPGINELIDNSKITLDDTLNIDTVLELHGKLMQALKDNDSLEIDAANVNSIDTASLQLLVVLKQEAFKLGKDIVFDFPSDRFIEAAELLGIDNMLGVDQSAAGFF